MKTFETVARADADKTLRLVIPVEKANRSYHLVVQVEPAASVPEPPVRTWPPGFLEATAGRPVGG
jgi:hypothetical protein